jgi:hypothetical protein
MANYLLAKARSISLLVQAIQVWTFLSLLNPLLETLLRKIALTLLIKFNQLFLILIHLLIHQGFWTNMKINLISSRKLEPVNNLVAIIIIIAPMKMSQSPIYRALYLLKKLILKPQNGKKIKYLFAKIGNFPTKNLLINYRSKI